jgi:hypothetical protein
MFSLSLSVLRRFIGQLGDFEHFGRIIRAHQ